VTPRLRFAPIALAFTFGSCTSAPEVSPHAVTVIEHVTVIPMDRPGALDDHSVLIDGDRIVSVAPAANIAIPASARRVNGRGKFLVPGLADMHAHDIEPHDLELYAAAGVTQLRVLAANPAAIALRDEHAGGDVFRPSVYVEGLLTDGTPPSYPFAQVVKDAAGVTALVKLHQQLRLPSIKAYGRLTPAVYDALVTQGHAAGLHIVGHVPRAVGLEHVLDSGQRSIEHLFGYEPWLTDETRMAAIAAHTESAGAWNCPTLVLREHGPIADNLDAINLLPGMRYVEPAKIAAWQADTGGMSADDKAARARDITARHAMVRALDRAGARLLVGTDTGNPFVVPGFSVIDEIVLFVQSGVSPWAALRAATSAPAEYLGQSQEMGAILPGHRADLLLLAGNPLDDINNLRRREGVMLRGVWYPAEDLDDRLKRRAALVAAAKSQFDGIAAPVLEGTRELTARFEMRNGGILVHEQRLFIVKRPDGTRMAIAELKQGDMTGVTRVWVEIGDGGRSFRHEQPGGILTVLVGVFEARRETGVLRVMVRPPYGAVVERSLAMEDSALLGGDTLAPDVLIHERLGKLGIGQRVELSIARVIPSLDPAVDEWRLRALRQPDGTRTVAGRDAVVRRYELEAIFGSERVPGSLVLDTNNQLVEQQLGSQRTIRIE
jgi:imidazolonepropionase-like amidohydrolase